MRKLVVPVVLLLLLGVFLLYKNRAISPVTKQQPVSVGVEKKFVQKNVDHIFVIVLENKEYQEVIGSHDAPYLNAKAEEYVLADNYFATSHPSLPNYLALIGGSTFGITSDCTDCFVSEKSFVDQLEEKNKTWKAYMESMPSACFLGNSGEYVQKHNPFIYFDSIRNNEKRCQNIVPYSELSKDLQSAKTTPDFVWISPNLCHDMHDCPIADGDKWLSQEIPMLLSSAAFQKENSLLFITFDEAEEKTTNKIPTIVIGKNVKRGFVSKIQYTHYSLLKTMEMLWGISPLTSDVAASTAMTDLLKK